MGKSEKTHKETMFTSLDRDLEELKEYILGGLDEEYTTTRMDGLVCEIIWKILSLQRMVLAEEG